MTSSTKEPKLFVVAGCLRGITALMVNFTKTMEEGGSLCVSYVHIFVISVYSTFIQQFTTKNSYFSKGA